MRVPRFEQREGGGGHFSQNGTDGWHKWALFARLLDLFCTPAPTFSLIIHCANMLVLSALHG